MASRHVAALRARRPHGPYVLGGHCNGALVAFEMARQLVAAGEAVPATGADRVASAGQRSADDRRRRAAARGYVRAGALRRIRAGQASTTARANSTCATCEAIDRYAGGPFDGDALVINAERSSRGGSDGGWHRFVSRSRLAVVPGDHTSLLTVHLDRVAGLVREAVGARRDRARGRQRRRGRAMIATGVARGPVPLVAVERGGTVESVHLGSVAVVDAERAPGRERGRSRRPDLDAQRAQAAAGAAVRRRRRPGPLRLSASSTSP